MILLELVLEDYKQFAGLHRFTPSPEGIVAIIGHNGAGKTTLFEAIEWCLYQPRTIGSDEIPPRGQVAKPRVRLTMQDPDTGVRYVVERRMNRQRIADAEVYREDEPEKPIVQGSRAVSDYVARTLIGLSHRAFVSTFFTRQKELTFFGDLKETDRRREVGRLLGMETIRDAQRLIGEERTEVQQQARVLEIQGQEAAAGRDFAAELAQAEARIGELAEALATAEAALANAEAAHGAARVEVERLAAVEREDAALRAALERTAGDVRAAAAQRQGVLDELARLETAAAERAKLAAVAAKAEMHRSAVQTLDLARERYQGLQRLRADLDRATGTLADVGRELQQIVATVPKGAPAGWTWSTGDAEVPVDAAGRLIAIAATVDADAIDIQCGALTRAADLAAQAEKARAQLSQYQTHLERLERERAEMLAGGDPHARRDELTKRREACIRTVEQAASRLTALGEEIERLSPVLDRLRAQQDGATCPTCGRPIEGNDIAITIGLFESNVAALHDEQRALTDERAAAAGEAAQLLRDGRAAMEQAQQLDTLQGRIDDGKKVIAKVEADARAVEAALRQHLEETGLPAPPTGAELDEAAARLALARKIIGSLPLLRRLETTARSAEEDRDALARDIAAMGEVVYDQAAHEAARQALKAAETAAARVAQIDAQLAARPEREAEVARLDAELSRLEGVRAEQEAARAALGFDPTALEAARAAERAALDRERAARDARSAAAGANADAVKARDALVAEHERIAALLERAQQQARRAGELDTMYREFNGFEQFVADRLTPQLADYTSELLAAITEGKYDQAVFTNNYGIEVYDGTDEHFPVDEFSGGERDVIALCARLALSRLIGGQASNPPGFMVLDEVFGSLDRERRVQVLEALGSLAGTATAYHQLFIISHVDDVRSSPIFNEVWRVAEGADGVSRLENLNLTGGFEDV